MTYCVGIMVDEGLVMVSDSRTNAGVDHIATFRKMRIWETRGERVIALMCSGNLAITQSVITLLNQGIRREKDGPLETLLTVNSLFHAARLVGAAVREVYRVDAEALQHTGTEFAAGFILGGQIAGQAMQLFQIYSAGNFIEATPETLYFQIGESKYGKPILDRVIRPGTSLADSLKLSLISMDSTLRSNISVGMPLDVLIYPAASLSAERHRLVQDDDPYFSEIRTNWSLSLRQVFTGLPDPDWLNGSA